MFEALDSSKMSVSNSCALNLWHLNGDVLHVVLRKSCPKALTDLAESNKNIQYIHIYIVMIQEVMGKGDLL